MVAAGMGGGRRRAGPGLDSVTAGLGSVTAHPE
jgi:hypothetical protein